MGLYEQDYYLLDKCSHVFHKECLAGTFKSKISNNIFPLLCPGEGCKAEVINSDIKQILNKEDFVKF